MRMVCIFDRWPLPVLTSPLAPLQTITYFQRVLHVKGAHLRGKIDFKVDINRLLMASRFPQWIKNCSDAGLLDMST